MNTKTLYNKTLEKQSLLDENKILCMKNMKNSQTLRSNSQNVFRLQKEIDKIILGEK